MLGYVQRGEDVFTPLMERVITKAWASMGKYLAPARMCTARQLGRASGESIDEVIEKHLRHRSRYILRVDLQSLLSTHWPWFLVTSLGSLGGPLNSDLVARDTAHVVQITHNRQMINPANPCQNELSCSNPTTPPASGSKPLNKFNTPHLSTKPLTISAPTPVSAALINASFVDPIRTIVKG